MTTKLSSQVYKISFALFFFVLLLLSLSPLHQAHGTEKKAPVQNYPIHKILALEINASINPATYSYLKTGHQVAGQKNANLILIKLNTPGGLVSTTKDILTLIGDSKIPMIIWITPEGASATSAGAIMASGAHGIFMSSGTNIGAATPVTQNGKDLPNKDLKNKAVNDLVALVSGLAEARGKNAQAFAEMIVQAKSFHAQEALKKNIIDGVASSEKDILAKLNGMKMTVKGQNYVLAVKSPTIITLPMDLGQRLLNIFANPSMAYILFLIGAALLYLELQAPGGFIAGSVGAILLILAGIGLQVLPLNFGALGLIVLAFVLFIVEIYITSYGIISLAGLAALITGSLFLFRTDNAYIEFSNTVIASAISGISVFLGLMLFFLFKGRRDETRPLDFNQLIGKTGIIMADLSLHGNSLSNVPTEAKYLYQIKVSGEIWKAYSESKQELDDQVTIVEHHPGQLVLKISN